MAVNNFKTLNYQQDTIFGISS